MRKLKGWIPTGLLVAVILFGSTVARADGVIIGGLASSDAQPCTVETKVKVDSGVIIGGYTGVIIGGFTGVIIGGLTGVIIGGAADVPQDCGVIIGG